MLNSFSRVSRKRVFALQLGGPVGAGLLHAVDVVVAAGPHESPDPDGDYDKRHDDAKEAQDDARRRDTAVVGLAALDPAAAEEAENYCDDAENDAADDSQQPDDRGHQ